MYWKIQKLKWLIRWEFWKRCSLTPKITRITVWNKGMWQDIIIYHKYKGKIYVWTACCEYDFSDLFLIPKYFKIAFDNLKQKRGCDVTRLGRPFE